MRVLVAGASGAIGRPLLQRLQRNGHEVVGLVHSGSGEKVVRSLGATAIVADVLSVESVGKAIQGLQFDAIVHELTAYRNAPPTRFGGKGVRRTNALRTIGTRNLLQAAAVTGANRFVTQSLILGYGISDHGSKVLTEDDSFGVLRGDRSDPAISAIAQAEQLAFAAPHMEAITLRYGIFYGPGASDMFAKTLQRMMLPLPSGGTGTVGWVHIDDAAEATVAAVERGHGGRAYNVVDDEPVAWDVMLEAMAAAVGARRPIRLPAPLIRLGAPFAAMQWLDMSMRVSNARAAQELGWKPAVSSYREGVQTLRSGTR